MFMEKAGIRGLFIKYPIFIMIDIRERNMYTYLDREVQCGGSKVGNDSFMGFCRL